jgi:hypothetical protein
MHSQAVMRVIEMTDLSLYHDLSWAEQFMLRMVQAHYSDRMYRVLSFLPAKMTTEVLAESEKMSGVVMGFSQN